MHKHAILEKKQGSAACLVSTSVSGGRDRPRQKQAAGRSKHAEAKIGSLPRRKQAICEAKINLSRQVKIFLFLAFLIGDIISLYMPRLPRQLPGLA